MSTHIDYVAQHIYTRGGFTKESLGDVKVLHLGCGSHKIPNAVGIDSLALPGVDVVHDLDSIPWPLKESSFDVVVAHAVLEHLVPFVQVMEEIHRVARPGARVVICVPYFRSVDAFTDPTHEHFFTSQSLDYFTDNEGSLAGYQYTKKQFHRVGFWYGWPHSSRNPLRQWFKNFIHKHPRLYDQYLSLLFPVPIVIWELEVRK